MRIEHEELLLAKGFIGFKKRFPGEPLIYAEETENRLREFFTGYLLELGVDFLRGDLYESISDIREFLVDIGVYKRKHPKQQIFDLDLVAIEKARNEEHVAQDDIADAFGVSASCISYHLKRLRLMSGVFWKLKPTEPTSEKIEVLAKGFYSAKVSLECVPYFVEKSVKHFEWMSRIFPPKPTEQVRLLNCE